MKPKNKQKQNISKTDNTDDYINVSIETLSAQGIHHDDWLDLEADGYTIIYENEKEYK